MLTPPAQRWGRTHPNIAYWNSLRFSPFAAALEMLIGVVACRLVMLDTDAEKQEAEAKTGILHSITTARGGPSE